MRRLLLPFLLLLGSWLETGTAQAQSTTIAQESFESASPPGGSASSFGYSSFTSNTFDLRATAPAQYFIRSQQPVTGFYSTNITGIDGTWLWAGEGVRGQVGGSPDRPPAYVQLSSISISGKSNVQVKVLFADSRGLGSGATAGGGTNQWENDDFVRVKVRVDNASTWTTIGQFVGDNPSGGLGGRLRLDSNRNGFSYDVADASSPALTNVFQDFLFNVSGTGSTLDVMVEVDANGGSEELAFDNIRVLATQATTAAPVLANIEGTSLNYNEGDPATQITSTLTASDADSPILTGGSVSLTTGFVSAQDRLSFTNQNGITGAYDINSGVLTLSGMASVAAYQAALRSVRYQNIEPITAIGGLRLVSFSVTDGITASNTASRNIIVTAQLNAPAALPYVEDFETNGEGLRYATDTWSTTNPCLGFLRTNQNPYACTPVTFGNISNSYYWYSEGTTNGANPNPVDIGTMTLAPVNASNANNLHFNIRLGTGQSAQWEIDDFAKFYYRVNGGAWVLFAAFYGNGATTATSGEMQRDTNLDGVADGVILNSTLQNVDLALPPAVTGASVDFQIIISSDGQEELAFDRINITGTQTTTVNSIVRANPTPTSATTVNYTVTFGGPVTGLTASNFSLTTSGLSGATVGTPVSTGTGSTWTVPVNTGTGSGTLTLNLANDTNLSVDISTTLPFAGETYTIDKTAPTATISRQNPTGTATNATAVTFRVTFSEAVTGVSTGSFTLNATGTAAGTLASIASVSTSVYDVTVSGVSGNGTLGITLKSTGSGVTDPASNAATGVVGPTYTIDTTTPTVTFTSTPPSPTNSTSATFAFTGSDGTGSGVASFQASLNSAAYVAVASPLTYTGLSNGTYTVQVRAIDNAGNVGTPASFTFTVDTTPPTVTLSSTVASGGSTTTSPVSFTAQFSESVGSTFIASDITVSGGTVGSFAAGSAANSYTFSVTPSVGTVSVSIAAGVAQDAAGNTNTAATPNPYTFTYALPSATVASIARQTPAAAATATTTVSYLVTFSAPVAGVTASNFSLTTTGISGASVTGVSPTMGSSATYSVAVNTGTGNGTLQLNVATSTGITPSITNTPFNGTGAVYTITKSFSAGPQLSLRAAGSASGANNDVTVFVDGVQVVQNGTSTTVVNALQNGSFETNNLGASDYLYPATGLVASPWAFTSQAGVARIGGSGFTPAASGQGSFVGFLQSTTNGNGTIAQSLTVPTGTYQVNFVAAQRSNQGTSDQVVNVFLNDGTNDVFVGTIQPGSTYASFTSAAFSVSAPALTATVSTTASSPTSTSPIPFTVTFSQSVGTTFTASDVTVTGGGTPVNFSGSGAGPYTFNVIPSGAGTVTVSLAAGVANDTNNTGNSASNPVSVQYQLPTTTAPVLTTPANGATTSGLPTYAGTAPNGSTITIYLTPNGGTAQAIGTTTATGGSFSLTPATALASGTYSVYAAAQSSGGAVSANSNTSTFTVDATAPTVVSVLRQNPAAMLTNATTLTYRLTFSEGVTGVSTGDFSLTRTGTAAGTVSAVAVVSTSVYDVTVTSASGDGTLRLDLNSTGTGIADLAGNGLAGGYTSGQTYTLDNTAPTATTTTTAANPTSTSPIPFTVTFSEAVTGLTASGITVTNGTITTAITSSGNAYSFSVTPAANGAVTVSVAANATQDAAGNGNTAASPLSVTYTAPITATIWTGTISSDWFTAGNWTAGVPTATIDATISASAVFSPTITGSTATTRGLTINSGASLTMSAGTLDVRGNWVNNNSFVATGGTVVLGTSAASNILGSGTTRFWSLRVESTGAQLATSAGATVQQVLTLNGGFSTNGNSFTLLSNATGTALVVNNGSNEVSGTVTVQRAIDPSINSGIGYRHYSAPVSNSTVADLATSGFTPVVNPAYNSAATPNLVVPFPTVFGYDDSRLNLTNSLSSFDKGYFSPAALSDPLAVGRGYTVNIGASEVVDFQGTLNNGTRTLALTSTRPTYPDGGWQFLGNPYPAPLDYSRVAAADRIGLESAIYVYSSTSQYVGRYRTYVNGIGNPVVPVGQGFFARAANGQTSATMTFRNSQRLTTPNGTTMQRPTADPRPLVQLTLQGNNSAVLDEAYVYFENGASSGFEPAFDAEKLANPSGLNLSTNQSGRQLSIDGQPELGTSQRVVPLAVGVPAPGVYTFTASQLLNLSAVPVYLRDTQLGTLTDLRQQPSYQFTVASAAALNTTRFELVFSPQQPLATVPAALAQQVALYPNPARTQVAIELPAGLSRQPVTASLLDALGRVVRTQVLPAGLAAHTLPLADLATGVYSLRLTTEVGTVVKKLVVE